MYFHTGLHIISCKYSFSFLYENLKRNQMGNSYIKNLGIIKECMSYQFKFYSRYYCTVDN